MKLTLARELLEARGYQLDLRESEWRHRTVCRLYACHGEDEHFLCSIVALVKMSTANFRSMVAQLPETSEAAK